MIKKFFLTGLTAVFLLAPAYASAASDQKCYGSNVNGQQLTDSFFSNFCIPAGTSASSVVNKVFNILLGVSGVVAVIFLVWGGIRYIISAGNVDQIEQARTTIYNAVIGIVVILVIFIIESAIFSIIK